MWGLEELGAIWGLSGTLDFQLHSSKPGERSLAWLCQPIGERLLKAEYRAGTTSHRLAFTDYFCYHAKSPAGSQSACLNVMP